MSSVQRFLRQRVVGNTLLSVDPATTTLYVFVAGSGNYVGNYPNQSSATPGYMSSVGLMSSLNSFFGAASVNTLPVLRDMGKTIYAGVGATPGTLGAFRQVQIINPVSVASPTASSNFGVNGSVPGTMPSGNAGDDGYNTFYISIPSNGVIASGSIPAYSVGPITGSVL